MSVMVNVATAMTNGDIAKDACERRFQNVKVTAEKITGSCKVQKRSYPVNFELDLKTMQVRCDSDYKNELIDTLNEAYRAEEVIRAANDEGRAWEEYRNKDQELVIEVEYS